MEEYLNYCLQEENDLTKEIIIKMFKAAEENKTTEVLASYKEEDINYCLDLLHFKFCALSYSVSSGFHLSLAPFKELYNRR